MLRSSAPLHLHPPKYWRTRPAKDIATVPIDRRRGRTYKPQDRRYCGPDQSIDTVGDRRPRHKPEVATQHPRPARRRIRRGTRRSRASCCCRGRGGGPGRTGEDPVQREAHGVRGGGEAQGHQGDQEPAGAESGGLQEVCGERAQDDEGLRTKGRGREDRGDVEGAGRHRPDGVEQRTGTKRAEAGGTDVADGGPCWVESYIHM